MTDRHVRLGEWEARDDLPQIRKQYRDPYRGVVVEYHAPALDRRVYETWKDGNGELMGRWTWESRA